MSETRSEETGQFVPAETFGREHEERAAGYVPYKEEAAATDDGLPVEQLDGMTVEQAAAELAQSRRTAEADVQTYSPIKDLAANVTLTAEQAAKLKNEGRKAEAEASEEAKADEIRAEVDKLRGEKPTDEKAAEEAKGTVSDDTVKEAKPGELDPEVEKALSNPKIQAALSQHVAEVETARQTYTQAVSVAQQFARASFIENFPEIAGLPVEQWEGALGVMAQREPERFNKALGTIQRVVQLQGAQEEQQQAQERTKQARLQTYVKAENARFEDMVKDVPREQRSRIESAIAEAIQEYGGDLNQFIELMKRSEFSDATVQRLLFDVGKLRMIQKAPKALPQGLPAVQRPGAGGPRVTSEAASIKSLQAQMKTASPSKQMELSAKILGLKRAARG